MDRKGPVTETEALLATVARLFATEGNSEAVELLSIARADFEWYSHDNWDGGFDIWTLRLEVPLGLYTKIGPERTELEEAVRTKLQAVLEGHSADHIHRVEIRTELKAGPDWRSRAQEWLGGGRADGRPVPLASGGVLIRPTVFSVPQLKPNADLISVMMPFAAEFGGTYDAIRRSCEALSLQCMRADDLWEHSTFIQDIVNLIYQARVVIVDFSGRNPKVMYETGIAHTLGREVVPITRAISDVPSDLRHHRALEYLPNVEGYEALERALRLRLSTITGRSRGPETSQAAHGA